MRRLEPSLIAKSIANRRWWLIAACVVGSTCSGGELDPPPPGQPGLHSLEPPAVTPGGNNDTPDSTDEPRPDLGEPDATSSSSDPTGTSSDNDPTGTSSDDDPNTAGIWGPCNDPACPPGMDCFEQDGTIGSC